MKKNLLIDILKYSLFLVKEIIDINEAFKRNLASFAINNDKKVNIEVLSTTYNNPTQVLGRRVGWVSRWVIPEGNIPFRLRS